MKINLDSIGEAVNKGELVFTMKNEDIVCIETKTGREVAVGGRAISLKKASAMAKRMVDDMPEWMKHYDFGLRKK